MFRLCLLHNQEELDCHTPFMGTRLCNVEAIVVVIAGGALLVKNEQAEYKKNHDDCVYLEVNSYRPICPTITKFVPHILSIY